MIVLFPSGCASDDLVVGELSLGSGTAVEMSGCVMGTDGQVRYDGSEPSRLRAREDVSGDHETH